MQQLLIFKGAEDNLTTVLRLLMKVSHLLQYMFALSDIKERNQNAV